MSKYLEVMRLSFKMQIIWRFDVVMTMAATIARILAGWIVWQAIFASRDMVAGLGLSAMLSYYLLSAILRSIDFSHHISSEINYLIRQGTFAGHLVAPHNPLVFFSSMCAGQTVFHLGFSLVAALIATQLLGITMVFTGEIACLLLALLLIPLGLCFMAILQYIFGILTFRYIEIGFILHVQFSIIEFATGALIPLVLLPAGVLSILRWLPFNHVIYTPVMLLTGQMGYQEGLEGLLILGVWTAALAIASQQAYRRLRTAYDGVGI